MPNIISFPGLGIGNFSLNPVAFSIFGHDIMWYGIIITLGMIVGFFVALNRSKLEGIKTDDVFDLAIFLIIFAMVGARLYYVLMRLDTYDSFYEVIAIWNGGLAIYGGVIAGAITIFVVSKVKRIVPAKMYDMVVPGLIIGQSIGRWGNFTNAEAHGTVTNLPWRMGIIYGGIGNAQYYHPTFLYESLWNLVGFALMMIFYKKKKFDGQITVFYITWYGFGRFFIEGLRTDSLYLGPVRISQVVAAVSVVLGVILMIMGLLRAKERRMDEEAYDRVYTSEKDSLGLNDSPAFEIVGKDSEAQPEAEDESMENEETDTDNNNDTDKENN